MYVIDSQHTILNFNVKVRIQLDMFGIFIFFFCFPEIYFVNVPIKESQTSTGMLRYIEINTRAYCIYETEYELLNMMGLT